MQSAIERDARAGPDALIGYGYDLAGPAVRLYASTSHPMNNHNDPTPRKRVAFIATLSVCGALLLLPLAQAAGNASFTQLADKAAPLPVSTSFEKVSSGEDRGQSVLIVKNTSPEAINVSATIVESVTFHANAKNRTLPEHPI